MNITAEMERRRITQLIEQEKYDEALRIIEKSAHTCGKNGYDLMNLKAEIYAQQGKLEQAEALYHGTIPVTFKETSALDGIYRLFLIHDLMGKNLLAQAGVFRYAMFTQEEAPEFVQDILLATKQQEGVVWEQQQAGSEWIRLAYLYANQMRMVESLICWRVADHLQCSSEQAEYQEVVTFFEYYLRTEPWSRLRMIKEELTHKDNQYMLGCFGTDSDAARRYELLAYGLSMLSTKVYLVCGRANDESLQETKNIVRLWVSDLDHDVDMFFNHMGEYIPHLVEQFCADTGLIYFGQREETKQLYMNFAFQKQADIFYKGYEERPWQDMDTSLLGTFNYRASKLYQFDVAKEMRRKPSCKFSIVIPTRNSADTLKYTLQTCLQQNFADYEIIISDNSDRDNTDTEQLISSLHHHRIRYFRTPYEMETVGRHFEFAYLHARGEFILSLGSDDGVMPHCLSMLEQILKLKPEEDVVLWDRMLYIWPSLARGNQDMLSIPKLYSGYDKIDAHYIDSQEMVNAVVKNPNQMYGMPLCYINSGFRRRYIQKVVNQTGRLINSGMQDIGFGVLNLHLNQRILKINMLLTIAGMSGHSLGAMESASCSIRESSLVKKLQNSEKTMCNLIMTTNDVMRAQRKFLVYGKDYTITPYYLLQMEDWGLAQDGEKIDYRVALRKGIEIIQDFNDDYIQYYAYLTELLKAASFYDSQLAHEMKKEHLERQKNNDFRQRKSIEQEKQPYLKGYYQGAFCLDMAEFQIENIEQVVHFVEHLFHWSRR